MTVNEGKGRGGRGEKGLEKREKSTQWPKVMNKPVLNVEWDPSLMSVHVFLLSDNSFRGSTSTLVSEAGKEDGIVKYSESFTHVPYGFQPRKAYYHPNGCTDIMGGIMLISATLAYVIKTLLVI